ARIARGPEENRQARLRRPKLAILRTDDSAARRLRSRKAWEPLQCGSRIQRRQPLVPSEILGPRRRTEVALWRTLASGRSGALVSPEYRRRHGLWHAHRKRPSAWPAT